MLSLGIFVWSSSLGVWIMRLGIDELMAVLHGPGVNEGH